MSDNVTVIIISGSKSDVFNKLNLIVSNDQNNIKNERINNNLKEKQLKIVNNFLDKKQVFKFRDLMNQFKNSKTTYPSNSNLSAFLKLNGYSKNRSNGNTPVWTLR